MRFWTLGGFFSSVKGHVVKWWQFVLMPVLRINNNGNNPQTGQLPEQSDAQVEPLTQQSMSQMESKGMSTDVQTGVQQKNQKLTQEIKDVSSAKVVKEQDMQNVSMPTEDPMEVMRRINAEKEEKRRKEIENTKQKVSEEARIAAIMNANKVDVNAFIEAGKVAKEEIAARKEAERKAEDLRRAQEVMERLNREAAEDQAKKQVEIEAAKQEAKKRFG